MGLPSGQVVVGGGSGVIHIGGVVLSNSTINEYMCGETARRSNLEFVELTNNVSY